MCWCCGLPFVGREAWRTILLGCKCMLEGIMCPCIVFTIKDFFFLNFQQSLYIFKELYCSCSSLPSFSAHVCSAIWKPLSFFFNNSWYFKISTYISMYWKYYH